MAETGSALSIDEQLTGSSMVITLQGELDPHTSPVLAERVEQVVARGDCESLTLDVGGITFIDSSGLRALISAKRAMEEANGTLELRDPTPATRRLLQITGLDSFLDGGA